MHKKKMKISKIIPTFSLNGCICGEGLYGRFFKCKFGAGDGPILRGKVQKYLTDDAAREQIEFEYGAKIEDWDVSNVKDFSNVFAGLKSINKDISKWDTSSATNMTGMFDGVENFNQDISSWDTSNVESMATMFAGCKAFNQDINKWNVSKVKDFNNMFFKCKTFDKDIGSWNLESAESVYGMFYGCEAFNQNIGNWKLTSVKSGHLPLDSSSLGGLDRMFFNCKKFNQDISNWDISTWKISYMCSMFEGCESFDQDISKWNVSTVVSMDRMFAGCKAFNQDISGWDVSALVNVALEGDEKCYNMFSGATSMKKENLPKLLKDSDIIYKNPPLASGGSTLCENPSDDRWNRMYTACDFPNGCPWAEDFAGDDSVSLKEKCMYASGY